MEEKRIPFNYGLFYYAMVGWIGREPNSSVCMGWNGYYEFRYKPRNGREARKLEEATRDLAQWLDLFEITFSGSVCRYGPDTTRPEDGNLLLVRISHPVAVRAER